MAKRTWALGRSLKSQEQKYTVEKKLDVTQIYCPTCGALTGQWCKTKSDLVCFEPHKERLKMTQDIVKNTEWLDKQQEVQPSEPDGLPMYVTVNTRFNVYKITYICTSSYHDEDAVAGEAGEAWVIAKSFNSAEYWFEESFNRGGSIYYIDSIQHVNRNNRMSLEFADYVEGF